MNTAPVSHDDFLLLVEERRRGAAGDVERLLALKSTTEYQEGRLETDAAYYRIHFRTTIRQPEHLERIVKSLRLNFAQEGILRAREIEGRLMRETWLSGEYDLFPKLKLLGIPTLIIHGDNDIIPVECAIHIAQAIPGARFVLMRETGHFSYLERSDEVRQEIVDFFHQAEVERMTVEQPQGNDIWATGDLYELYMGRWSRLVARQFVHWLEAPAGMEWLDIGCGTGALTQTILDHASPKSVKGIDRSPGFIAYATASIVGEHARFEVADVQSLPIENASMDAVVTGLFLNFLPEPMRAVTEMARVTRPHGVAAAYVWDYAGKMELLRYFWDVASALDRTASELDEGRRFSICEPEPLEELFVQAGFLDVEVRPIDIATDFHDFDDYWSPFLGGQGPAPGYAMSLDEARRDVLRDELRSSLPIAEDGAIHLIARAWAVRGRKP
jgi:SAM-dependent methyltransferase